MIDNNDNMIMNDNIIMIIMINNNELKQIEKKL